MKRLMKQGSFFAYHWRECWLSLQILFGGASSGGLGMLANIDFIQELVKPAEVWEQTYLKIPVQHF